MIVNQSKSLHLVINYCNTLLCIIINYDDESIMHVEAKATFTVVFEFWVAFFEHAWFLYMQKISFVTNQVINYYVNLQI